ncbi:hypothetical protein L2E82_02361 [Cichorium intybus]|uniref:Uncharacterized protein n=1 Tax=Cichorium intybus TaxID=13427 RepID=A0ACB9H233_CICIN|nr:hypothetical protein L2E82_02361 [Cichorium intybus]
MSGIVAPYVHKTVTPSGWGSSPLAKPLVKAKNRKTRARARARASGEVLFGEWGVRRDGFGVEVFSDGYNFVEV